MDITAPLLRPPDGSAEMVMGFAPIHVVRSCCRVSPPGAFTIKDPVADAIPQALVTVTEMLYEPGES